MIRTKEREEIEQVLRRGAEILEERPELRSWDLEAVLNELDDGTQKMLHDRWGAVAHLFLMEISEHDVASLVPLLAKKEDRDVICGYVGYLLLTEQHVDLRALLVEAENQGKFDAIVPYVGDNLQYEPDFSGEMLRRLLGILNHHRTSGFYRIVLENCAAQATELGVQAAATACLGDLAGQAEREFLRIIAQQWYTVDREQVMETVERLFSYVGAWSKMAGFDILNFSLTVCDADFLRLYPTIEQILQSEPSLRPEAIPMLVEFVCRYDRSEQNEETYSKVLMELQEIPDGSLEERRSFLQTIEWKKDRKPVVEAIFQSVICRPFDKDADILNALANCLCSRAEDSDADWNEILHTMQIVFSASGFSPDYSGFFDCLQGLIYDITQQAVAQATAFALMQILTGNLEAFYFGLGLLTEAGNILRLSQEQNKVTSNLLFPLADEQLVSVMKSILYCTHDSNYICQTAYQLLLLAEEPANQFMAFLMQEVYRQYPGTMSDLSESFQGSGTTLQMQLAYQVTEAQNQEEKRQKAIVGIRDLTAAEEHHRIFLQAQMELMRQAEKKSKPSVFQSLFPLRHLKYGARFGWTMQGRDGQRNYQVSAPAHFSHQMELPAEFVNDPVQYGLKRQDYLKEVRDRAADPQGLLAVPAGKG